MALSQTYFDNGTVHQNTLKILMETTADVFFIFEGNNNDAGDKVDTENVGDDGETQMIPVNSQNDVVKIPAHKQVLAALSPVFNAEFNGLLREQGDVKIVGASPATFNTFLQFFYECKINLTIDTVEEVMNLIDRYDVATAWPICVEFLMKKLTNVDDILWGLSMAMKFRLDDLKAHFTAKIQSNCAKVCNMIELDDSGKPKLRSNPNNRPLCDADLATVFPQVFAAVNVHLLNPTADPEIDKNIIPFTLTTGVLEQSKPLGETHYFTFRTNARLLFSHLEFSQLFEWNMYDEEFEAIECNVNMWVQEKDQTNNAEPITLFTHAFKLIIDGDNRVDLPNPIEIKPDNFTYRVYAQMTPYSPPVYAKQTIPTNYRMELAPNTFISFINPFNKGVLAKALYFRVQPPQ